MGLIPDKEKPSIPKQKLEEYFVLVFGEPNVGKTSFANQFPNSLFALFEGGTSGLLTNEVDCVKEGRKRGKSPWTILKELKRDFLLGEHDYQTLIIDTEDRAYEDCLNYICKKRGIDHPSEEGYGQGWNALNKEFQTLHRDLEMSPYGLVAISHADFKEVENIRGQKRDKIIPSVGGSSGQWLVDEADIIILYDKDEDGNRIMRVESSKDYDAKQRITFPENIISAGDSAEEAFNNFKEAFDKAIENVNEKYGITDKMIKEYYNEKEKEQKLDILINEIKTTAKEKEMSGVQISKEMNEVIGCSKPSELTIDTANKFLKYLKNK